MRPNIAYRDSRVLLCLSSSRRSNLSLQTHKKDGFHHRHLNNPLPLIYPAAQSNISSAATTTLATMSSDEAYASFLEKADQPTGATSSTSQSRAEDSQNLAAQSSDIPPALKSVDETFTSESDEPFVPFAIEYSGSALPNVAEFAKAIKQETGVEEIGMEDFDPRGEYKDVVDAVRAAAGYRMDGEVRCFRIEGGKRTQVFYYIVGLERERGRLVGFRAVSVES